MIYIRVRTLLSVIPGYTGFSWMMNYIVERQEKENKWELKYLKSTKREKMMSSSQNVEQEKRSGKKKGEGGRGKQGRERRKDGERRREGEGGREEEK